MKRPSFQFYPADYIGNSNLRRCSHAARGAWMDTLCALHDSDEYGALRWTLKDIATAIGAPIKLLQELASKGVLKGSDKEISQEFVYVPRSGRKEGDPVTLIGTQPGPLWYSSRMVKDEYVRRNRGGDTRFGDDSRSPNHADGDIIDAPKPSPNRRKGAGPSSSSSSSPSGERETRACTDGPLLPSSPTPGDPIEDRMPSDNARRMAEIKNWINSMHPSWQARPVFTYAEDRDLLGNFAVLSDITDADWRQLRAYMHFPIPKTGRNAELWADLKLWQPDIRSRFVGSINDLLTHSDNWARRCRREGINIDLGGADP